MNFIKKWYKALTVYWLPYEVKPPFTHLVQVGDPILRSPAHHVIRDDIQSENIQKLIKIMKMIIVNDHLVGISAPQVGVPLRIVALQLPEKLMRYVFTPEEIQTKKIEPIPLQVWINPEMRIVDYATTVDTEMCGSVLSLKADVKRFNKISLKGLDEKGDIKSEEASDFKARIIQHEMDHLEGVLFTDRMNPKTLQNVAWKEINELNGYVELNYYPKASLR